MEAGTFTLFKVGDYDIRQVQVQYNSTKMGVYANNEAMWVYHKDKVIATKACPTKCEFVRVSDPTLVTAYDIRTTSAEYWPTSLHPGRFETMLVFTEYSDLRVFVRGYDNPVLVTDIKNNFSTCLMT